MNRDETHSKPNAALPTGGASLDNIRTLMRRPQILARAASRVRLSPLDGTTRHEPIAPKHNRRSETIDESLLSPFAKQLQLEKRRADRTRGPLSIVLFRAEGNGHSVADTVKQLCAVIQGNRRETDIPSQVGADLVAILLLDTNEDGAGSFVQKILDQASALPLSAIAQAYPGHLFDNLLSGFDERMGIHDLAADNSAVPEASYSLSAALSAAKARWLGILRLELD